MSELLDAVKVVAVIMIMLPACISDWRKREASDVIWMIMGAFGIVCMAYVAFSDGMKWEYVMMIVGSAMILIDILWDHEKGIIITVLFYAVMAVMFIVPMITSWDDQTVRQFTLVPASYLLFVAMFFAGLIKGGADAKCLITLAMVFQTYPVFSAFPFIDVPGGVISEIFGFPLMVFFHAALFTIVLSVLYLAINLKNGDKAFPAMFLGYKADVQEAKGKHVWPMEKVEDGKAVLTSKGQDETTFDELEKIGAERVWVTPMIPFLIPITIAIIFVAFVGNILFLAF